MESGEPSIYYYAAQLIIQLSVITTFAWLSDVIMQKLSLPRVIGYILVGILIGPYVLGAISIGGIFPDGLFPHLPETSAITRGNIKYFAIIASVILLFNSGLETDVSLFLRYAVKGSIIGMGGLIASFFGGYAVSLLFFPGRSAIDPSHLFMGTMATATSVGITTSILSGQKKMSSPEGVTILSAAVLDDVIGIVILAVATGISEVAGRMGKSFAMSDIVAISAKALLLWLGCAAVGILFARKFGRGLKKAIHSKTRLSVLVLGIAFSVGGFFESAGISMIIGAYIVGLTLSNTDLSYVIQEKIAPIFVLFVPIFFIVSGMSLDIRASFSPEVLLLGVIYTIVCFVSKFIGAGLPALGMKFTPIGAARIGTGMIPRGEVALIIASIGLSSGFISTSSYSAVMMMIVLTSLISPLLLNSMLAMKKSGTKIQESSRSTKTEIDFKHGNLARFIVSDFLQLMEEEGFFVSRVIEKDRDTFHIRKDNMFLTLHAYTGGKLLFFSDKASISFFKTALYEASTNIAESAQSIKQDFKTTQIALADTHDAAITPDSTQLSPFLSPFLVQLSIQSSTKKEIIQELSTLLFKGGYISDEQQFLTDIFERERTMSTGMQNGIAIPHARSSACKKPKIAVGLKPSGADFNSLDGNPSTIFILIASPEDYPHVSILAKISSLLNSADFRTKLLACNKETDVIKLFT